MSFEKQAAAMSQADIVSLLKAHEELKQRVAWFERQLFGTKSERRMVDASGRQLTLGEMQREKTSETAMVSIPAHRRHRRREDAADDEALRFDSSVPVEEIVIGEPKDPESYTLVSEKVTCRLAQRPGSYVVLRYVRKVYKRKSDGEFSCPPAPAAVLERSCADVSFLAGLLIEKLVYHLPLYRQHQRLRAAGIHLSRTTLTNLVHRTADLLRPVYEAQLRSILSSDVLAMDETPVKAGRRKRPPPHRGKMKTGYFWPLYGDKDEIAFPFAETRGSAVVREALKTYCGVLLSDGYKVYEQYAQRVNRIVHAQCWSHARRHFEAAESVEGERSGQALDRIAAIYAREAKMKARHLSPEQILADRAEHTKPLVDGFFEWLRKTMTKDVFLPTDLFGKAARYVLAREEALKVFLEYPGVPLDTNHLERAIRPIAIGRKNWLFCWTEIGAEYVGIVQSLLSTCRIQGIHPYTYLVDVLQRMDTHPAKDVAMLTPRLWKQTYADKPLRSAIDADPAAAQMAQSATP